MKISTNKIIQTTLVALFWIAIWYVGALIVNQPLYLPSPLDTAKALIQLIGKKILYISIYHTLLRVLLGFALSVVSGIVLAVLSHKVKIINVLLSPLVATIKPIPIMSIIILLLVWLTSGIVPVMVCFLLCLPIVYTNTLEGLNSVDKDLLEMASVFGTTKWHSITKIILPSVWSHIYSAIMLCIGFSWKAVVTAEVMSSPQFSIGYNLYTTKLYLNTDELFAWTIIVVIISMIFEKVVKRIIKWTV